MTAVLAFVAGLLVGCPLGLLAAALCVATRDRDRQLPQDKP